MDKNKLKVYLLLPYLRTINSVKIGNFTFKGLDDIVNEEKTIQEDLGRIAMFFRQRETAYLQAFAYLVLEDTQEELNKKFIELKKSLEVFRYLTVDPEGKELNSEHTTPYVVFPKLDNPWRHNGEEHFAYRVNEGFFGKEHFVIFPHASKRPPFIKEIYGSDPPYIDEKLMEKLMSGLTEKDLRAITWYNKTFSISANDDKENLLRLSVAFESHFTSDEEKGKQEVLTKISDEISTHITEPELTEKLKKIKPFMASMIVKQLADEVFKITESESITKWFKRHLYSVGSGIRHGDEVSEVPKPVISKGKLGKSLYYAGDASHEYLNNVYFGKRLFKFLLEEMYFPSIEYIKKLNIEQLEKLLIADEERLKDLEQVLASKKVGELTHEDIRIAFSFNQTFFGSRVRVLNILKRLLEEIKTKPTEWKEISPYGDILLGANLTEDDFSDYEKTKPFYHALIEIGSIFYDKKPSTVIDDEERKNFYIQQFVSYALHRFI